MMTMSVCLLSDYEPSSRMDTILIIMIITVILNDVWVKPLILSSTVRLQRPQNALPSRLVNAATVSALKSAGYFTFSHNFPLSPHFRKRGKRPEKLSDNNRYGAGLLGKWDNPQVVVISYL